MNNKKLIKKFQNPAGPIKNKILPEIIVTPKGNYTADDGSWIRLEEYPQYQGIHFSPGQREILEKQLNQFADLNRATGNPTIRDLKSSVDLFGIQGEGLKALHGAGDLDYNDYLDTPQGQYYVDNVVNPALDAGLRKQYMMTGAVTPVYPEFDLLTLGRSLYTMPKWRPFLPKGTSSTVYRQGGYTMLDDALETGLVRPKPKNKYLDVITKDFDENVMFNKIYPFYGSTPEIYPVAFVGNTNKTSAIWKHLRHKGHKNIFEPYMNGSKQAPLSEFRIFTSAPFKFGWYETPMKNSFHLPVFGLSPLFNEDQK